MDRGESITALRDLAGALVRHRRKMTLCFVAVMGVVIIYAIVCPRAYRSQAKLFVRLGRENATLDPTATVGQAPVVAVPQSRENEINSAVEILNSRILVEKVVDSVGPQAILYGRAPSSTEEAAAPEERYRAITRLSKRLNVEPVKKSNVILVSYDGLTPELAQTVVANLISYYQERHIQLNRNPGAHQFFAEQSARQRGLLTRAEEELRDLKNETGLVVPEVQRQILVTRIGRLQDELMQTSGALAAAEAEVRQLREKLSGLSATHSTTRVKGIRNEAADTMRGQLYALQLRELEASQKYPAGHPEVQRLRQQSAAAKEILNREEHAREQVQEGPNRVYEEAQLALLKEEPALSSLRAKANSLQAQLDQQRAELKTLNENSLRVTRLEREFSLQESHYRRYAENLEQAQIDRALEAERISNISVVQPATLEIEPVQPRLLLTFGIGILLAALGSFGLMVQAERSNATWPHFVSPSRNGAENETMRSSESLPGLPTTAPANKLGGGTP